MKMLFGGGCQVTPVSVGPSHSCSRGRMPVEISCSLLKNNDTDNYTDFQTH